MSQTMLPPFLQMLSAPVPTASNSVSTAAPAPPLLSPVAHAKAGGGGGVTSVAGTQSHCRRRCCRVNQQPSFPLHAAVLCLLVAHCSASAAPLSLVAHGKAGGGGVKVVCSPHGVHIATHTDAHGEPVHIWDMRKLSAVRRAAAFSHSQLRHTLIVRPC